MPRRSKAIEVYLMPRELNGIDDEQFFAFNRWKHLISCRTVWKETMSVSCRLDRKGMRVLR